MICCTDCRYEDNCFRRDTHVGTGTTYGCNEGEPKPDTYYDRFISKTPEELAAVFSTIAGCPLNVMESCPNGMNIDENCSARRCWLSWLMQEADE